MEERRSPAERIVDRAREDIGGLGEPLSRRARQTRRSVEAYLNASGPPRWMERLVQIERGTERERRRLEEAHRALRRACGDDAELFARRWHEVARSWRFDEHLVALIRQHNEWYPIERRLPIDPHTRDYVLIHGRSYRRPKLGPAWILERFPASPPGEG